MKGMTYGLSVLNALKNVCPNCGNTINNSGHCYDCHWQDKGETSIWLSTYGKRIIDLLPDYKDKNNGEN